MICPHCIGAGNVIYRHAFEPRNVNMPCSLCHGCGSVDDRYAARLEAGQRILVPLRERFDLSAREAARRIRICPAMWAEAESGHLDIETVKELDSQLTTAMEAAK